MSDYMKEAERLLSEYGDAVSDAVVFAQDPAGYSMRMEEATRAALLAHIRSGVVPNQLDDTDVADMAQAPDATQEMVPAPAEVPMPEPAQSIGCGWGAKALYTADQMRAYGDAREAAGYARGVAAQKGGA